LNSRIPLVRTSSKSAARRRPRRGAARNRGPGADPAGGTGAPTAAAARGARAGEDGGRNPRRPPPDPPRARRGAPAPAGLPGCGRDARRSWGDPREGPGSRPESPPPPAPRVPGPPWARGPRGGPPPPPGPRRPPAPPPRPHPGKGGGERRAGGAARGGAEEGRGGGPGRGCPGRGGGGGASSSRGARPAPLRAPARPTQPLEPILIPKLRIRLADFPYLHCSNMPEAVHLGDLLRIWVRPGARFTPSPPDFQGPARAHRTPPEPRRFPRHGPLSRGEPIPGRPALHKEKRTLPGAPAGFSGIGCVTALDASRRPSPPLRIRGSEPDSLSIG
uniref:Uncharacterized protein n=2 Tax=Felis catus TaxID=9685 RepID=A0ABI7ZHX9_FELCA